LFSGSYIHAVDSKGRVTIPSRFASRLGEVFIITKGLHGCLWIFPREEWSLVAAKLEPPSLVNPDALALQRFFLGAASEVSLDAQGRLALPALLREYAGIKRDVVVVGTSTRIEIWSRERWDEFNQQLTDERIAELGREIGL